VGRKKLRGDLIWGEGKTLSYLVNLTFQEKSTGMGDLERKGKEKGKPRGGKWDIVDHLFTNHPSIKS